MDPPKPRVIKEELVRVEDSCATPPILTVGDFLCIPDCEATEHGMQSQGTAVNGPSSSNVSDVILHDAETLSRETFDGVTILDRIPQPLPVLLSPAMNNSATSSSGVPQQMPQVIVHSQMPSGVPSKARNVDAPSTSSSDVPQQVTSMPSHIPSGMPSKEMNIDVHFPPNFDMAQQLPVPLPEQMSLTGGGHQVVPKAEFPLQMQDGGAAEFSSCAQPNGAGSCSSSGVGTLSPVSGDEVNMTATTYERTDSSTNKVAMSLLDQTAQMVGITSRCAVKVTRLTGDPKEIRTVESRENGQPQRDTEDGAVEGESERGQTEIYEDLQRDRNDPDWEELLEENWDEIMKDVDDPFEYTEEQKKRRRKKDNSSKKMSYSEEWQVRGANVGKEDIEDGQENAEDGQGDAEDGQGDAVARTGSHSKRGGRHHVMQEESYTKQLPRLTIVKKKPPSARRQKKDDRLATRTSDYQTDDNPGTSTNTDPYDRGASTPFHRGSSTNKDPPHPQASISNNQLRQDRSPRQTEDSVADGSNGSSKVLERIASTLDCIALSMQRMESKMDTLLSEVSSGNTRQRRPDSDIAQPATECVGGLVVKTREPTKKEHEVNGGPSHLVGSIGEEVINIIGNAVKNRLRVRVENMAEFRLHEGKVTGSRDSEQMKENNRLQGGLKRRLVDGGKFTGPKRVRFLKIPRDGQNGATVKSPKCADKQHMEEKQVKLKPAITDDATVLQESVSDQLEVTEIQLSQDVIKQAKAQAQSVTGFAKILLRKLVDKETLMMSTCSGKHRSNTSSSRPNIRQIDPNILDYVMGVTYKAYKIAATKKRQWERKCKEAITRMCLMLRKKKQGYASTEGKKCKSPSKEPLVKGSPGLPVKAPESKTPEKKKVSISQAEIQIAKTKAKYIGHFSWLVLRKLVDRSTLRLSHTTGVTTQRSQRPYVQPVDPDILAYVLQVTYKTYGIAPDKQPECQHRIFISINSFCRQLFNDDLRQIKLKKRLTCKSTIKGGASESKVRAQKHLANKANRKVKEGTAEGQTSGVRKTDSQSSGVSAKKKGKSKALKNPAKKKIPLFEDGILQLKDKSADPKQFTRKLLRKLVDDDTLMQSNCSGFFGNACRRPVKGPIDPNILEYVLSTTREVYNIPSKEWEKSLDQFKTSINEMCRGLYKQYNTKQKRLLSRGVKPCH